MAELQQVKLGNGTYAAVTKTYVDEKIAAELEGFDKLDYKVADSAPTPTTVVIEGQTVPTETGVRYLVAHPTEDSFEEYVLIDGTIYDIGSTSNVDLSGYATTTVTDALDTRLDALEAAEVDHVELTQAQYDALTPAEKNNGTVYFITDAEVATVVDQTYDATSPHAQSGTAVAEAAAEAVAQIKTARLQFAAKQVTAGSQVNFPVSELTLPSDLSRLIVTIPISPGPETWGTSLPAIVVTSSNHENVIVRAYVTGNYTPLVDILYV